MRICVTGSSGQIGSYVVDLARASGIEVAGIDLRPSKWTTHVGDVRRGADCRKAIAGCSVIIHCAAQVSVQGSIDNPLNDLDHNIAGTVQLLEEARRDRVSRVILTSSAAVYGTPATLPVPETHLTRPLSPYGASKLACEIYARVYQELHQLECVVVRPFNVYSIRQDPSNPYSGVLSKFAQRARAGQAPLIFGDGTQSRDFIHASDVASAMLRLAESPLHDKQVVLNLGTGTEHSIRHVADLFCQAAGIVERPEHGPERAGEIRRSVADVKQMLTYGIKPVVQLKAGVDELLHQAAFVDHNSRTES